MNKTMLKLALSMTACLLASVQASPSDDLAELLKKKYPTSTFDTVSATPLPGIFEVTAAKNVFYVDKEADYLLFGSIYDMKAGRDITAERKEDLARFDMNGLDLSMAMKEVKGTGARVLAVFTDPDCPYCHRLEQSLRHVTDITIYRFPYPIASLHPEATTVAKKIWCSGGTDDLRTKAFLAYVEGKVIPSNAGDCKNPIDDVVALANKHSIRGTPTLVSGDGRTQGGARDAAQIEAWLGRGDSDASQSKSARDRVQGSIGQ